jgi:hypothetical protein
MFWAFLGVVVGAFAVLLWLRRLTPDSIDLVVAEGRRSKSSRSTGRSKGGLSARTANPAGIATARSHGLKSTAQPFAALSIKPGENACGSAADMRPVRFLQDSAPHLPLEGCDRLACNCSFVRYQDRRTNEQGERRERDDSAPVPRADEPVALLDDRRELHGRRITDHS